MSEMITISIVVPVYNVEPYLHRCLDSIIHQTYQSIDVILVDDGSTDNSGIICDEYANNDGRIRTIHKTNSGVSDARNAGMKEAKGEYLLFIDSDDYIELDACECLAKMVADVKYDIVAGGHRAGDDSDGNAWLFVPPQDTILKSMAGIDYFAHVYRNHAYNIVVWNKMYRLEFLRSKQLWFRSGFCHEDMDWTPRVLLHASSVVSTDLCFYHHCWRKTFDPYQKNADRNMGHVVNICHDLILLFENSNDREQRQLLCDLPVVTYLSYFYFYKPYLKEPKQFVDKAFVQKYAYRRRNKLAARIFSISPTLFCLAFAMMKFISGNKILKRNTYNN